MQLTEEEAKTKWCPFTFNKPFGHNTYGVETDAIDHCCASMCMAWRRIEIGGKKVSIVHDETCQSKRYSGFELYDADYDRCPDCQAQLIVILPKYKGYCGLAGNPLVRVAF